LLQANCRGSLNKSAWITYSREGGRKEWREIGREGEGGRKGGA